jgi:hypothetical protein
MIENELGEIRIRTLRGEILSLWDVRERVTDGEGCLYAVDLLDALEAALSVPKRSYERDDEKAVTAYNFAIADVRHAAGKIEE